MYGSDYAHRDWMDWDDGWSEWYPKLGFGGYCYFYRTTIPSLWSVEPQSRHTNRSLVLPLGDKYKITVHYFSYDKAYRDEAVSYVYRVDEEKLPYRWIEARSHHIHVWLNGIEDVKSWLTKAPNRLNGKPVKIEWSDTSLFGRKS